MNNFDKFCELIEGQFKYGGKKYAADNKRESTDILFDDFSYRFSLGTVGKYCFRYNNLARERDLLKISCYCYIYFLKRGFHLSENGSDISIDTTVKMKEKYFDIFIKAINIYKNIIFKDMPNRIDFIYNILRNLASEDRQWINVSIKHLTTIFWLSYLEWEEKFSQNAGQDQDINLVTDNK